MTQMSADDTNANFSRRQMFRHVAAAGLAATSAPTGLLAAVGSSNAVVVENNHPGTRDWMLRQIRVDPKSRYRCPWIEGFCSHRTARAGETITFYVSTNPASPFTLDIYRTGYYGGNGGRLIKQLGEFQGIVQPEPPIGPKRVRNCEWQACAELQIPADWLSGVYLGKLTALRAVCKAM